MTLSEYIYKRNGVPVGNKKSLQNNLYRSFGARNFAVFWNYWNPIFGYYLGNFIFKPLRTILPVSISVVFTFVVCGLIHDAVTFLFRGTTSYIFTIWFLLMGVVVIFTKYIKYDFSHQKWITRAIINASIISFCLMVSYGITRFML